MSNRPGRKISRQTAHRPPPRKPSGASLDKRVLLIIASLAAAGIVVGLIAVFTGNSTGDPRVAQTNDNVQVSGTVLPTFSEGGDPAIGLQAPSFTTIDFDGFSREVFGAGGASDTAKVIGFFAHWCPHCQAEVPAVSDWLAGNTLSDGVEVIAVSTLVNSGRGNYPPSAWFEDVAWSSPVLLDSDTDTIGNAFGLSSVPYWVVLDENNTVLHRQAGSIGVDAFVDLVDMAAASRNN